MDGIGNLSPLAIHSFILSPESLVCFFGAVKPSTSLTEPLLAAQLIGQTTRNAGSCFSHSLQSNL